MKKFYFVFLLCMSTTLFSQGPPSMAKPKGNQIALIDEFVKVSNYEQNLKKFGMHLIFDRMHVYENGKYNISQKERRDIINSIDFERFKKGSIYNAFSFVSENDLKKLINLYKNTDDLNDLFLNNSVIIKNYSSMINRKVDKLLEQKNKATN